MKASIVTVGTELLFGQIINTNAAYISDGLNRMGVDVMYHFTVGDNPSRLEEILEEALKRSDLVITTGGLGPTQDDMTKEIVCKVMKSSLILHQPSLQAIESFFAAVKRPMTENNRKQAMLPERAIVFQNGMGTAPGFALTCDNKTVACLPGPPREMTGMFEKSLVPFLEKQTDRVIYYQLIRTYGIGESSLETELLDLINGQTDPTIATYALEGESYLRVASKAESLEIAKRKVDGMTEKILSRIGQYVYSTKGQDLVEVVCEQLMQKNISISCAESCTGGLFASTLLKVPGMSAIFDRGFVTYSNQSKIEELGVLPSTIETYGAVSPETAKEMSQGVFRASGSNLCIAITGIAGPDGGSLEKPVGLVFISLIYTNQNGKSDYFQEKRIFKWNQREKNREAAVLAMLNMILQNVARM